jgi:hypothetical protein
MNRWLRATSRSSHTGTKEAERPLSSPPGEPGKELGQMDLRGWISDEIARSICQSAVEEPT